MATKKTGAEPQKFQNVKNRNNHRIELEIDGKIVVFMPGATVKVPANFVIPQNLGLYVK